MTGQSAGAGAEAATAMAALLDASERADAMNEEGLSSGSEDENEIEGAEDRTDKEGEEDGATASKPEGLTAAQLLEKREANRKKKQLARRRKKQQQVLVEEETDYEVDIMKKAKTSTLLRCEEIPEYQRMRLAIVESNPWMLIVSNLPHGITSYEIKDYFNALLLALRPEYATPIPVINVELATSRVFATLEFTNKAAKAYTLTLKNIEFQKCVRQRRVQLPVDNTSPPPFQKLIIMKPRQYFFRTYLENTKIPEVMFDVDDGSLGPINKVYLGGLPNYLKDHDVRKLCENFGKLKYFNVAKQQNENKESVSKGYCFFEYEDGSITEKAIKALNGLPCGDRKLKASRVTKDQNKLANTQMLQNDRSKHAPSNHVIIITLLISFVMILPPPTQTGSYLGGSELIKKPEVQKMLTIPEWTSMPSRVVQFLNMVSIEDLFEEDIVEELRQDVQEECEKIGPIDKIEIPLPCPKTGICSPSVGKVFVKFK